MNDDEFYVLWSAIHKKGIFVYMLKNMLPFLLVIYFAFFILFITRRPTTTNNVSYAITNCLVMTIIVITIKLKEWLKCEKRYKNMLSKKPSDI
jgi:hypothetical protein